MSEFKEYCDRVKVALAANAEGFCSQYLSAGKRVSGMWHVGSPQNDKGDSLKVHLRGDRAGTAYYNREERGLSALDLFMEARGIVDFAEGVKAAGSWLGMEWQGGSRKAGGERPKVERKVEAPPRKFERVGGMSEQARELMAGREREQAKAAALADWKKLKPLAAGDPGFEYLVNERGIDPDAIARADVRGGLRWMPKASAEVPVWAVAMWSGDGKDLLNVKYIAVGRGADGDKDVRAAKGCEYHLLGMNLVGDADVVVICEGETDWLSCLSEGIAAVSVPFGAKADGEDGRENAGNRWIQNDWDWLNSLAEVVVAMDNDDAGTKAAATLLRRLPEALVRRNLVLGEFWPECPKKGDLNDLFLYDPLALHRAIEEAGEVLPETLARASDYRDMIYAKMFRKDGEAPGYEVHSLGSNFRWRLSEWTIVTGYEGCGKTTWLGHQVVDLASRGCKVCIASLENQPWQTYEVMFTQALGCRRPLDLKTGEADDARFNRTVQWFDDRIYCYRNVGFTKLEELLELFGYTARRYGVRFFVIDSLMMLQKEVARGQSDLDRQSEMAQMIKLFCDKYDAHLFLVAHAKKVQDEKTQFRKPVRPQDVKGAGDLVNLCFNLVSIYMNDEKLYKLRDCYESMRELEDNAGSDFGPRELEIKSKLREKIDELEDVHDSQFFVLKQRNVDLDAKHPKPSRRLWFHAGCRQLWEGRQVPVKVYVE